ncbi:MAG: group III truncated hemoglobin [Flavitalea sp.]
MKKDIQTRSDIEALISGFYLKVKADPLIGPIFTDVAKVNWEKHLPLMFDFWENTLFYTGAYSGNPMKAHQRLHRMFNLKEEHFTTWVGLFKTTVDELFEGEKALLAKQRAVSISTVIQLDLFSHQKKLD